MKPILFNTEMVRAILDDSKTVTRRVMKDIPLDAKCVFVCDDYATFRWQVKAKNANIVFDKEKDVAPPYRPGDILYVRETWTKLYYVDEHGYTHYDQPMYYYAADGVPDITLIDPDGFEEDDQRIRWRPSIHMPREAARIFLRVTDVRVERLQEIDEDGAIAEGLYRWWQLTRASTPAGTARQAFMWLWQHLTRKAPVEQGWAANPWVWVIAFERCSKPEETP